jgi:N-hydroxyarylamine O-acetyltransferase
MAGPDFDRYAERIRYSGPRVPSETVLADLHRSHAAAIPFENLDIHLGTPIHLEPELVFEKLVARRRGGYCFEQNMLFLAMLRQLGFSARPLCARVSYGPPAPRPRTHMLLLVELGALRFLSDVGFGTHNLFDPLPFEPGRIHRSADESFRVLRETSSLADAPPAFTLEVELGGAWTALYRFTLEEQQPIDFEMANWFTQTFPESMFVKKKIVSLAQPGGRKLLIDGEFRARHGAETLTRQVRGAAAYRAVLLGEFGLELPPGAELEP